VSYALPFSGVELRHAGFPTLLGGAHWEFFSVEKHFSASPEGALVNIFTWCKRSRRTTTAPTPCAWTSAFWGLNRARRATPRCTRTSAPSSHAAGVQLGRGWQGYGKFLDQCEIQVDRADGKGWAILTFDTTTNYTDTIPFPTALTKWKYRAIYRVDDAPVGQWSAEVSVNVGG